MGFESVASAQKAHKDKLRVAVMPNRHGEWALEPTRRKKVLALLAWRGGMVGIGHGVPIR